MQDKVPAHSLSAEGLRSGWPFNLSVVPHGISGFSEDPISLARSPSV